MDKPTSQFDPQFVDEQIAQIRQQAGNSTPGATLIDDLYNLHDEDLQIRDRVWARLNRMADVAREQQTGSSMRRGENLPNIAEYQETSITSKESKAMEENTSSWRIKPLAPLGASKKRLSPLQRGVGIGLIAAVALITIVSFTVFSGVLRSAPQTANNTSTIADAQNQQQQPQLQKVISSGKQVCSLNAGEKVSLNGAPWSADLSWSAQGQLIVGTYSGFKEYSTKNCTPTAFSQPEVMQVVGPLWSPDGSKLLVGNANSIYVLDRNGKVLTKLNGNLMDSPRWSSDSNQIIFIQGDGSQSSQPVPFTSQLMKIRVSIKAVDVNHGNKVTTLTQLPKGYSVVDWSSDVKTIVVRSMKNDRMTMDLATWDTDKGKLVSNTSLPEPAFGQELSPDGSMLALDSEGKIEIYATDTWKLLASFENKVSGQGVHTLAWSPDGKYLAESTNVIKIYDVNAKKIAATFGGVDTQHWITTLVWSPDGTGLATSTMVLSDDQPSDLTVNVWALS